MREFLDKLGGLEREIGSRSLSGEEALAELRGFMKEHLPEGEFRFSATGKLLTDCGDPEALLLAQQVERVARHWSGRDRLRALSQSGALLTSSLGLDETLRSILRLALQVTGARYGIFRLLDEDSTSLLTAAVQGDYPERPLVEALELSRKNIMGWVALERRSVLIADLHQPPWNELYFPLDHLLEMRSELAVPLLGPSGRLEGVLNLESPELEAFSEEDRFVLENFAHQAVAAIRQARFVDALQGVSEPQLRDDCPTVLTQILKSSRHVLGAVGASVETSDHRLLEGRAEGPQRFCPFPSGDGGLRLFHPQADALGDWESKVLACWVDQAALALEGEARLRELRDSQRRQAGSATFAALGDMAANLLHQVNNKVGIIPVRVQGLLEKHAELVESEPYLKKNLASIQSSAREALTVVKENLILLRAEGVQAVSLQEAVQGAAQSLPPEAEVRSDSLASTPPVRGQARLLQWVFVNLFDNAYRARGPGLVVELKAEVKERVVYLEVTDNGPGIPKDEQSHLFEPKKRQESPSHLGFGLWWVRTLLDRMGGGIEVSSDGRSFTTFQLRFLREVVA